MSLYPEFSLFNTVAAVAAIMARLRTALVLLGYIPLFYAPFVVEEVRMDGVVEPDRRMRYF